MDELSKGGTSTAAVSSNETGARPKQASNGRVSAPVFEAAAKTPARASSTERIGSDAELQPRVDQAQDAGPGQQANHGPPVFLHHRQLVDLALAQELQGGAQVVIGTHPGDIREAGHDVGHAGSRPII